MIQKESLLSIADNSGAIHVKCLCVDSKSVGEPGDVLTVSLQDVVRSRKIKKGFIFRAVLISTRCFVLNKYGLAFKFRKNRVVLLKKNERKLPFGTRVIGGVSVQLRLKGFLRIILLSSFSF